ncbi:MAG: tRNA uridine(34) 5-carboxymethylaminomethyl modification radical SAM/GNAT enzyme Elp3 [archaeon]
MMKKNILVKGKDSNSIDNTKIKEFFKNIINKKISKKELEKNKIKFSRKYKLKNLILTSKIREAINIKNNQDSLVTKPSRSKSGVTVVAIMTKPSKCPGKCIFCPTNKRAPKSYTGDEPAAMRASRNKFDPFSQIKDRLKQLEATGHPTTKIELIVMGGTFPSTSKKYQEDFVRGIYQALTNCKIKDLKKLKEKAMTSKHRLIGLTFETRPDYCDKKTIKRLLDFGATRVEIGVQSVDNDTLNFVKRKHSTKEIIKATKELKDAGFKVLYHMMVNLPSSNIKKEYFNFKKIFEDPNYMPDMLKIYPCLVTKNTVLEEMYNKNLYKPYKLEDTIKLIADIKEIVPPWIRIMRIQRDIPAKNIIDGVKKSNLRQLVEIELKTRGKKCNCIRCNEPNNNLNSKNLKNISNYKINTTKYQASGGSEYFISAKFENYNLGFIRLRFPHQTYIKELAGKTAIVRELHVYGETTEFGDKNIQHIGIGKKLLKSAEEIAKENNYKKLAIISGIGVREYYRKLDYKLIGNYMIKNL